MAKSSNDLEEGEITDDSDILYTPLERPKDFSSVQPNSRFPIKEYASDDNSSISDESGGDNDDSDENISTSKKPKFKNKKLPLSNKSIRKKTDYKMWSTRSDEDTLSRSLNITLNNCHVSNETTYNNVSNRNHFDNVTRMPARKNNKRTVNDRRNNKIGYLERQLEEKTQGLSRRILNLNTNMQNNEEEVAQDIANKLYEQNESVILKVVKIAGKQRAIDFFNETQEIEAKGGMLIMNCTKRKTPGGVFLYLVRKDDVLSKEEKKDIFAEDQKKFKDLKKSQQKARNQQLKQQIHASRNKILPELLTKAELLLNINNRLPKETSKDSNDVENPPPTPETDNVENSENGMDFVPSTSANHNVKKGNCHDDDVLTINTDSDMDLL